MHVALGLTFHRGSIFDGDFDFDGMEGWGIRSAVAGRKFILRGGHYSVVDDHQ